MRRQRYARALLFSGVLLATGQIGAQQPGLFSGPSILSRGTRPIGRSGGRPIGLRFNLTFGTGYYGGLTEAGVEQGDNPGRQNGYAGFLGFGVAGTRNTPRSTTSGQYQGMGNLFGNQLGFSGVNHNGQFTHTQRVTRRLSAFLVGRGSMTNTVVAGFNPVGFDQPILDDVTVPVGEPFDNRLIQGVGGTGLTFQKSTRLSMTAGGGVGLQRRQSGALVDSNFYIAFGDLSYQATRRSGIGAHYTFMNVFHKNNYGESYMQTLMGTYQRTLSPHWSFGAGLGTLRIESDRLRQIAVDPLITAITGQQRAVEAFHSVFWGLAARATLNGQFRTSAFSFSYDRGANPGNGFVLSGQMERAMASYTYSGIRRTSLSAWGMGMRYLPVLEAFDVRDFKSTGAGLSFSYRLMSSLHFTSTAQYMRNAANTANRFTRDRYVLRVGLTFQPGEVPLVLW